MPTAIKIENVSKLYRLGTVGTGTISHDLNRWWHQIRGKEDPYTKVGQVNDRAAKPEARNEKLETRKTKRGLFSSLSPLASSLSKSSLSPLASSVSGPSGPDYVWALKDINLEVEQGEILGIIGRNGAGKSTLLKLLSRVTAPTSGEIKTRGRIASLLEVGTGFHPELTGRENIYLNGAILGMKRNEITEQLDAIVDFSGCERYLDTPVKRYSSGMLVRLGFAVAAHLECEILIVDEVLAVGDAEFQKKCLAKMNDVARGGRTVLFVSHNMAAIQQLCSDAILVQNGTITQKGVTDDVVETYLGDVAAPSSNGVHIKSFDGTFALTRCVLMNEEGEAATSFKHGDTLVVELHYNAEVAIEEPYFWIGIEGRHGSVLSANMLLDGFRPQRIDGCGCVRVKFPQIPLYPQQSYIVHAGMRYKDCNSLVFPSSEVGTFSVVGTAADCGLLSPVANQFIGNTAGMCNAYEWELSDGTSYSYDRLASQSI